MQSLEAQWFSFLTWHTWHSSATAIILGGLLIHGLVRPMLFIENAPQVYSIYLAILLAYVVVFLFQVNFIKHIVKILSVVHTI